jgi:hypothetical protein
MCVRPLTAMRRGVLVPHQRQAMVGEQKVQTVHRSLNLSVNLTEGKTSKNNKTNVVFPNLSS